MESNIGHIYLQNQILVMAWTVDTGSVRKRENTKGERKEKPPQPTSVNVTPIIMETAVNVSNKLGWEHL